MRHPQAPTSSRGRALRVSLRALSSVMQNCESEVECRIVRAQRVVWSCLECWGNSCSCLACLGQSGLVPNLGSCQLHQDQWLEGCLGGRCCAAYLTTGVGKGRKAVSWANHLPPCLPSIPSIPSHLDTWIPGYLRQTLTQFPVEPFGNWSF